MFIKCLSIELIKHLMLYFHLSNFIILNYLQFINNIIAMENIHKKYH